MSGFSGLFSRPCGMWVRQCPPLSLGYKLLPVGNFPVGSWLERRV